MTSDPVNTSFDIPFSIYNKFIERAYSLKRIAEAPDVLASMLNMGFNMVEKLMLPLGNARFMGSKQNARG